MPSLILEPIHGANLVLRDQSAPPWQPDVVAEAATLDIYMGYAEDPYGTAQHVGTVLPGATFIVDHNPDFDRDLVFLGIPTAKDGTRDIMLFKDAIRADLTVQRENATPTIGQAGDPVNLPGDNYQIPVGIVGQTRYARFRKVEISDTDAFIPEDTQVTIYDSEDFAAKELPRYIDLASVVVGSPTTRWVRISHSSGGDYGPTSDPLEITFPDTGGSGGSTGSFDPIDRGELEVILP